MSGKGSAPRPFSVSHDQFASNYDAIFGSNKMEQVLLSRSVVKQCLNTLLMTVEKEIADPMLRYELMSSAIELNKALGCKAMADRIAKRTVLEDEAE